MSGRTGEILQNVGPIFIDLIARADALEIRGDDADEAGAAGGWVAKEAGRDEPHEREDGDDPYVVRQRRAIVGPEESACEKTGDAFPRRHRLLVCLLYTSPSPR